MPLLTKELNGRKRLRSSSYLTDYVVFHFRNEADYMAKYAYSSALAHKTQHEQFVKNF